MPLKQIVATTGTSLWEVLHGPGELCVEVEGFQRYQEARPYASTPAAERLEAAVSSLGRITGQYLEWLIQRIKFSSPRAGHIRKGAAALSLSIFTL